MKKSICIIGCLLINMTVCSQSFTPNDISADQPAMVWVHYQDKADVLALRPYYDLWKIDEKNKTVLMAINHPTDYQELLNRGFTVKLNHELMDQQRFLKAQKSLGLNTIVNFPCYRTVQETYDAMNTMANTYPDLVSLVDIGDSWHKTEPGGDPGYDLQVVKITNTNVIDANKPILYAMGSIHSREYPPAELVTRFAEYLLSEYGNTADVTWLVDHHEIHLLLMGNPDGRVISENETSAFQRKNFNANHCLGGGGFGNMQGVDMNRNFEFLWNQGTGSSDIECAANYRGLSAVSEPETQAVNNYIQTLFPDERPDDLVTAAPLNKPGVYLDIHNVAELTLFPWGYADNAGQAPNHNQLQTLARRMSYFTGYRPEQSNASLGGADGASDDNAYGTLGVAAFTIELGEGVFYSSCSSFENTIWPDNLEAMIYATKAARMPYKLASGPDVTNLQPTAYQVIVGNTLAVSGTATDLRFNNNNGNEPTQNISAVKAYLGTPSWQAGVAIDMAAADGSFNSSTEEFTGSIDTSNLSAGTYMLWFEATDTAETGVPAAQFVQVIESADLGTLSGVVTDAQTLQPIEQVLLSYDGVTTTTDVAGDYQLQSTANVADLWVSKAGYVSQVISNVSITAEQNTIQNVMLEPTCDLLFDDAEIYTTINDAINAGWSLQTNQGTNDWNIESGVNYTIGGTQAFVSEDVNSLSDKSLVTPTLQLSAGAELIFWHQHQFEAGNDFYDGGVIEISVDGGSNWTDLGNLITQNGYNGTLNGGFSQPLGAVLAFVDTLGTFTEVKVDLSDYAQDSVNIRFRMGTDSSTGGGDWVIDDIRVINAAACQVDNDLIFIDGFEPTN